MPVDPTAAACREMARQRPRLFPGVLRACQRLLKDHSWAREVAEDIWMDFMTRHAERVQEPKATSAYLRVMAVRHCVRLRDWRERHDVFDDEKALGSAGIGEADLVRAIDQPRALAALARCMQRLSRRARQILRQRYHHGQTYAAIATRLEVSKQYVGQVVVKSIESLRRCVEATS